MAVRETPTNAVLLREIKAVKDSQETMQKSLDTVASDVDNLKMWQHLEIATRKAAKEAVDEYRKNERKSPSAPESRLNKDVIKQILYALTAVCIALIAVTQAGAK